MSVDAIGATPHKLAKLVRVRGDHFRRLEPVLYVLYAGLVLVCTTRRTEYCLYSSRTQYYRYLVKVYTNSILIIFDLPPKSIAPLHLAVIHRPCARNGWTHKDQG